MSWLDFACICGLILIAVGGYSQGLIRGVLRLAALAAGGLLGALLMLRLGTLGTPRSTAIWATAAALLGVAVSALVAWSATNSIPRAIHAALLNRLLGILPALAAGGIILALGLSLAERIALTAPTQDMIRTGRVTGPLIQIVDGIEQRVAGLR